MRVPSFNDFYFARSVLIFRLDVKMLPYLPSKVIHVGCGDSIFCPFSMPKLKFSNSFVNGTLHGK